MNWLRTTIGEHCTVTSSKRFHIEDRSESGVPFFCSKEIIQLVNGQEVLDCDYIREEAYEQVKRQYGVPIAGDLLITTRGTYGIPYLYRDTDRFYFADGNLTWLKDFDGLLTAPFLYYWIRSYEGQSKIDAIAKGTAQKAVPIAEIKNIVINLPPVETQRHIACILSAYDSLIETNQRQIKLLEEAAQRLYKEWFVNLRYPGHENVPVVDGVPEDWKKQSMEEIAEYLNGFAFKPSDWGTIGMPIIKIKELNEGVTVDTPRNSGLEIPAKYLIKSGDIVFSWSATLTAKIWDSENGLLNQHLFKVTPRKGIGREFVLQSILKTLDEFANLTTGATMKHIQRGKLSQVFVAVPIETVMNAFEEHASAIRDEILYLSKSNQLLSEARDRLLPKLMSGEIAV